MGRLCLICLPNTDKVIIGGGGILYDEGGSPHGQSNFDYYINQYLAISVALEKPVCLCGVGVQDLTKEENISLFRNLLKKVSFVSVRQSSDKDFFNQNQLFPNVIVADDLGFFS